MFLIWYEYVVQYYVQFLSSNLYIEYHLKIKMIKEGWDIIGLKIN